MAISGFKTALGHIGRLFTEGSLVGVADGQLLGRFVSHRDEDAFAMLVERHAPLVLAVCRRSLKNPGEVDDAFQATFLILARRPGSVRGRDCLGGWLYGVARRVCLLANRAAARRRWHERRAVELRADEAVIDMAHDDRWPEIYDEIDRLPATYRLPVVLCVLEGRTRAEAAAQLGWSEGSVRGRLGRAKELLRSRLVRRGFGPAVVLAALRHERASAEIVPRALIAWTTHSASRAAAGMVPASTAVLCREVLRTMLMAKLKLGALALLAAGGIGWGLAGVTATPAQPRMQRSSPPAGGRPAESGLEIVGTVRDKDTGKPLAGITVQTTASFGDPARYFTATTDVHGGYRLSGVSPKTDFGDEQDVLAAPKDGPPFVPTVQHVGGGRGPGPIRMDFALKRGAWARGRVIDQSTGKPLPGAGLAYFILEDNPHLKDYPQYGTVRAWMPFGADENGEYKIAVLPGRGILGAQSPGGTYRMGVGIDKIRGLKAYPDGTVRAGLKFVMRPQLLEWRNLHTLVEVDPKEGEASVTTDIVLDPGRTLKGKLVGPDGEPVAGALMLGARDHIAAWSDQPLPSADFEVYSLGPDAKRALLFYHEAKQLAGAFRIKPDEAGPVTVRLERCGTLTGRLVDAGGLPQAGAQLKWYRPTEGGDAQFEKGSLPSPIKTGKDGRFRVAGLVPGLKYSLYLTKGSVVAGWPVSGATTKAGEVKDLGDVKAVD
jgi:RNA polymerase sigma factor (sigma-70 family)